MGKKSNSRAWKRSVALDHIQNLQVGVSELDSFDFLATREQVSQLDISHAVHDTKTTEEKWSA